MEYRYRNLQHADTSYLVGVTRPIMQSQNDRFNRDIAPGVAFQTFQQLSKHNDSQSQPTDA